MKLPWRKRWTLALVGRYSGTRTSLESLYRFRKQSEALAKATEMNRRWPAEDIVQYEVHERA